MNDLAHAAGWEPYILHDLTHVSWVRSVLYRSAGEDLDDLDGYLSDLSVGRAVYYTRKLAA